jgi:hypothetical protein
VSATMNRAEAERLLRVCEETDDMDTGTLDAFREAATVSAVYELTDVWLAAERVDDELRALGEANLPPSLAAALLALQQKVGGDG